jgi:hypothetical protein
MEQASQRLKRRREFLHVARAGRKWAAPGLVLQVLDRHAVKNTDDSEHIENLSNIGIGDRVNENVGRAKTNARLFSDLVGDLETALRKLNAWHDAVTTANCPGNHKEQRNG